jgi:hypothetical protein
MLAAVAAALAFAAPARAAFAPGSIGLGDPYFPFAGNGGYDVGHYALTLSYDPTTKVLDGRALITARATQDLSRFDLDLRGFTVSGITVGGRAASFVRDGQELIVTPAQPLPRGTTFTVDVRYAGRAAGPIPASASAASQGHRHPPAARASRRMRTRRRPDGSSSTPIARRLGAAPRRRSVTAGGVSSAHSIAAIHPLTRPSRPGKGLSPLHTTVPRRALAGDRRSVDEAARILGPHLASADSPVSDSS